MERNLYLLIAYDGTDFHGWQTQGELRTVQSVMEQAFRRVCRHPVNLRASGRTDAGVHARGQVGALATTCFLPVDKLRHAVGSRLPMDVSLIDVRDVHPDFHPTHRALCKLYRYRIHNSTHRPVESMTQRYVYHYWRPLDVEAMRAGARHFVGTQDFSALCASGGERESMVRTVLRCDVERRGDEIRIGVVGTGFLYNQVRNMVGTLINVGRGMWAPQRVAEIIATKDRANAGPTAPALGLCLMWVKYPPELLSPAPGFALPEYVRGMGRAGSEAETVESRSVSGPDQA